MKKSERLNDMMMFLNNKNSFNIKDIMERYHISRSSAIRDIKSLEELGIQYTQSLVEMALIKYCLTGSYLPLCLPLMKCIHFILPCLH